MCYCCHLHHLCCEAGEFQTKHHPGLYDVLHNYHVKKKKKNSKKDWHVTLARKEFRCWSWFCFLQAQIHKKKLFYSLKTATWNMRLSFCLWNLQIVIIEYFVQSHQWKKYVHFQTFTSCLILQNFNLSNVEPNKTNNGQ